MQLDPAAFNAFGAAVGQDVLWRKSMECPCKDPDSGQFSADCKVCTNGSIWDAPLATHIALSGQKIQQQWVKESGLAEKGDVVCTLLGDTPVYSMGETDRVVFMNSSEPFSLPFQNSGEPLVIPFPVACIDKVIWLTPDLSQVIQGGTPTINAAGLIKWGPRQPPANTQFTIQGRRRPEFFCFNEFPQDRAHFHGLALPRRVVLRNFNLFSRQN